MLVLERVAEFVLVGRHVEERHAGFAEELAHAATIVLRNWPSSSSRV